MGQALLTGRHPAARLSKGRDEKKQFTKGRVLIKGRPPRPGRQKDGMKNIIFQKDEHLLKVGHPGGRPRSSKGRDEKHQFAKGRTLIKGRPPWRPVPVVKRTG